MAVVVRKKTRPIMYILPVLPWFVLAVATLYFFGPTEQVAGTYQGTITAYKKSSPVITTLLFNPDGKLEGTYTYGTKKGTLSNGHRVERYKYKFLWHEVDVGAGDMTITFTPDWKGFSGYWTMLDGTTKLPWTGTRRQETDYGLFGAVQSWTFYEKLTGFSAILAILWALLAIAMQIYRAIRRHRQESIGRR